MEKVTPSPAKAAVPVTGTSVINATWNVEWFDAAAIGPSTVTSAGAYLQINGTNISALGGSFSQTPVTGAGSRQNLTFSETLTITPALARQIAAASPGSVRILRTFTDGHRTDVGIISLGAGGGAGILDVRRIELSFENDARTDVVKQGDNLHAVADVSFGSSGLLRGQWRIIDPTYSLGTGSGRVLQVVNQQLASTGQGRVRIVSPALPTNMNGLYLLSFSVEDTDGSITIPVLRYFVLEGGNADVPVNIGAISPASGANVTPESVFSWQPLAGAQAYQVEILATGSETPITGKIVPAKDLKLSLADFTLANLKSGINYDWRVRAFKNGQAIGMSERRTIHIP